MKQINFFHSYEYFAQRHPNMDRFIGAARQSRPLPGMERAELAGGNEWIWNRENGEKGIPLDDEHQQVLQTVADELGVETPFTDCIHTRF